MSDLVSTLIKERRSVRKYDPNFTIEKEEILEMLEQATLAPSTSNLQPWQFLVFLDAEARQDLRKIAYNQEQIETASAVIAVLGDKEFYRNIDPVYDSMSEAGFVDDASKAVLVGNAHKAYPHAPEQSRINMATFDSGLAAMQFMLIAKERGYATGPMGGFDKVKFAERFNVEERYVPIVLITIGKENAPAYSTTRIAIEDKVKFI
ncbi:nitroreductase family protein [Sporosarcina sp. BI001-red]|uniref:nitroreductase family protein n=1 Tax=Sporosarcina sp. BI001-red TaxID=2282866 RepID=UPI000E274076|nr:nitroreductase family protein [Sporosarcina sp. BI001-red]REB05522.1 nitroreductase family protein [Sporosarcina sp. BI001-red]